MPSSLKTTPHTRHLPEAVQSGRSEPFPTDFALAKLKSVIERAAQLLPPQGPLGEFAFLNPLHGLEHLPFVEGLEKGAQLYGCLPYRPKDFYRDRLSSGRITRDDLKTVLKRELAESADVSVKPSGTRFEMRLAMLTHPLHSAPTQELRWFIAETDALKQFGANVPESRRRKLIDDTKRWIFQDINTALVDDFKYRFVNDLIDSFGRPTIERWDDQTWSAFSLQALWHVCRRGLERVEIPTANSRTVRHRGLLVEAGYDDIDLLIHPVLIRFCASFTDQGISTWELPNREQGFFQAFSNLHQLRGIPTPSWIRPLAGELKRINREHQTPLASIAESLLELGVNEDEWEDYLQATLLALPGWAGIIWQLESRPDRSQKPVPVGSLVEFVAIRLLLERLALRHVLRKSKGRAALSLGEWRDELRRQHRTKSATSVEQRIFYVFRLSQVMGWSSSDLFHLSNHEWATLVAEIDAFPSLARRRTFHLAYEHRFKSKFLNALACRNQYQPQPRNDVSFQAVFCLDAREESLRRHLEENSPAFETYGTAGFFGVAMYFRGLSSAHFAAHCPVVIRPEHWVVEGAAQGFEQSHRSRALSRRAVGLAAHRMHVDTRTFGPGAILSAALGAFALIPLVTRIMFPERTARIRRTLEQLVTAPDETRLQVERVSHEDSSNQGEFGYTVESMAQIGEKVLRDIGLTKNFARLVFLLGHGSACQNNPHEATYHCGACTGKPGGQNSRALATMLNHPQVRVILASRGLPIPAETIFVGGQHNTCDDTIACYDLDQLPASHLDDFNRAQRAFEQACRQNAHERCRRFYSAPLTITPEAAHRHVKDRSEDLAQTRPEFGNATNAVCIVGRRERTRGLFLDRRSFLQSYDPTQDDGDFSILARILAAVVPVCSGINMMYNLSALDSTGWGCGTKLPHNITSLLGVMDGAASDLRSGLPAQGVEIHEPVRLTFVLETTRDGILKIMRENPVIQRILGNGWAQLVLLDPHSERIHVYESGEFVQYESPTLDLSRAGSSYEWYRGSRDYLNFALIDLGVVSHK